MITERHETVLDRILRRVRRTVPPRAFREIQERLRGRKGLEVGGPSAVFQRLNMWSLYSVVGTIDTYDFAPDTIWSQQASFPWRVSRVGTGISPGRRLIGEASVMSGVESSTYDFLLASHVLEHIANPLKALFNWRRVVKPGGLVILVIPHREGTFDHLRQVTSLDHIVRDFETDVSEEDETHLPEILDRHDLSRDPGAGDRAAFVARARANVSHRSLHHHVFDTELVLRLADRAGLNILYVDVERPYHICVAGALGSSAEGDGARSGNSALWSSDAAWRRMSPFSSDRGIPLVLDSSESPIVPRPGL